MTAHSPQQTIASPVEIDGIGFFTGAPVVLRFLPAPADHGIAFQRIDCRGSAPIPARIDYLVDRARRTAIEHQGVCVEMIEHVMAALAGLRIDNCLIELTGPEPPGCDGSALAFVECLASTKIVEQSAPRRTRAIETTVSVSDESGTCSIVAEPHANPALTLTYELDYGQDSPIPRQTATFEITPHTFIQEISFARTFVLESEARALQAQGCGRHITTRDLLVFGSQGVIGNALRTADECARHKLLDCLGDFALLGCARTGRIHATRSGHHLNHQLVRQLLIAHPKWFTASGRLAA